MAEVTELAADQARMFCEDNLGVTFDKPRTLVRVNSADRFTRCWDLVNRIGAPGRIGSNENGAGLREVVVERALQNSLILSGFPSDEWS